MASLRQIGDLEVEWLTCSRVAHGAGVEGVPLARAVKRSPFPATLGSITVDSWRLARELDWSFDVVHSLIHVPPYGPAALTKGSRVPIILTVHTLMRQRVPPLNPLAPVHDRLWSLFERRALRMANETIVVSPHLESEVAKISGRPPTFIPNGVDAAWFGLDSQASDPQSLLCVGRVQPVKGYRHLLQSLALVQSPWSLTIIGGHYDRFYLRELKELEGSLGLRGRIRWLGEVPFSQLLEEMRKASIFVLPSEEESMPIALLEAMAAGKAVIATRVGGIPWILQNDDHGLLVNFGDRDGLATGIDSLLNEPTECRHLSRQARHRAADFSWEEVAQKTLAVYRSALEGRVES